MEIGSFWRIVTPEFDVFRENFGAQTSVS